MTNITPELKYKFESENPPPDFVELVYHCGQAWYAPTLSPSEPERDNAQASANIQNAKLEVWLKQREKIEELESALKNVQGIVCEGAKEGFNCHAGDWAERLFHSNQQTSKALGK